jgi:hypothetical protein
LSSKVAQALSGDIIVLDTTFLSRNSLGIMMTLKKLMGTFPNDDACKKFIMEHRWPNGVKCPRCQNEKLE